MKEMVSGNHCGVVLLDGHFLSTYILVQAVRAALNLALSLSVYDALQQTQSELQHCRAEAL